MPVVRKGAVVAWGLGKIKAAQLLAVLELTRRLATPPLEKKYQINCAADAARLVMPQMAHLDHEELRVLVLDTKCQVVANLLLYRGTANASMLRTAELFRAAITRKCSRIILCHNHPSNQLQPSPEDIQVTEQCVEAGKLLDIDVLDHLIIGNHSFLSLKEQLKW